MQTFEGWIASLQVFSVQNKIRRSLLYNFAYHLKSNGRPWLLQTFFTLLEKVKKKLRKHVHNSRKRLMTKYKCTKKPCLFRLIIIKICDEHFPVFSFFFMGGGKGGGLCYLWFIELVASYTFEYNYCKKITKWHTFGTLVYLESRKLFFFFWKQQSCKYYNAFLGS